MGLFTNGTDLYKKGISGFIKALDRVKKSAEMLMTEIAANEHRGNQIEARARDEVFEIEEKNKELKRTKGEAQKMIDNLEKFLGIGE